ncbi:hypothetical protein [Magnetofaba australis]|nr:hypothetical protein [Magnetofaba australis]
MRDSFWQQRKQRRQLALSSSGRTARKPLAVLTLAALVGLSGCAPRLQNPEPDEKVNVLVDLLVLRPVGAVATVAGTGAFLATLPIVEKENGYLSHARTTGREWVAKPAAFTFSRPLGQIPAGDSKQDITPYEHGVIQR